MKMRTWIPTLSKKGSKRNFQSLGNMSNFPTGRCARAVPPSLPSVQLYEISCALPPVPYNTLLHAIWLIPATNRTPCEDPTQPRSALLCPPEVGPICFCSVDPLLSPTAVQPTTYPRSTAACTTAMHCSVTSPPHAPEASTSHQ